MLYSKSETPETRYPISMGIVLVSLTIALFLSMLPWQGWALKLRPDFVAVVLLYWCLHKPLHIGIGWAWTIGLLVDVADGSLFGMHGLTYALLAYAGMMFHLRLKMANLSQQLPQVFGALAFVYLIYMLLNWLINQQMEWGYFLGCFSSALLWIPVSLVLREAQRIHTDKQAAS